MNCNERNHTAQLINLSAPGNTRPGQCFVGTSTNNDARDNESSHITGTLVALDRRLETIRKEQLAKNRSSLMQLDTQQLQTLEWVTTNITRKIFREVADELEHSASEDNGKRLSETVCLMLGLA